MWTSTPNEVITNMTPKRVDFHSCIFSEYIYQIYQTVIVTTVSKKSWSVSCFKFFFLEIDFNSENEGQISIDSGNVKDLGSIAFHLIVNVLAMVCQQRCVKCVLLHFLEILEVHFSCENEGQTSMNLWVAGTSICLMLPYCECYRLNQQIYGV